MRKQTQELLFQGVTILLTILFASLPCAAQVERLNAFAAQTRQVKTGMTTKEALALMGRPNFVVRNQAELKATLGKLDSPKAKDLLLQQGRIEGYQALLVYVVGEAAKGQHTFVMGAHVKTDTIVSKALADTTSQPDIPGWPSQSNSED